MSLKYLSLLLVGTGALILGLSIIKYHRIIILTQSFGEESRRKWVLWQKVHHLLMVFFFCGYIGVFIATLNDVVFAGELFSSLIFFFGAAFVFIGIFLQVTMFSSIKSKHEQLNRKNVQLSQAEDATIYALAYLAEMRDQETGRHIERTSQYVRVLVEELGRMPQYEGHIDAKYIEDLVKAAPLHDIGKVGVPDEVLQKPGKLTQMEFELIKKHPDYGADVLVRAEKKLNFQSYLEIGVQLVRYHHEKWDGSGYPAGIAGNAIPLSAQIMAVADVYDALRSERCYKKAFSHEEACAIIQEGSGSHFSPDLVDVFLRNEAIFNQICVSLHN